MTRARYERASVTNATTKENATPSAGVGDTAGLARKPGVSTLIFHPRALWE